MKKLLMSAALCSGIVLASCDSATDPIIPVGPGSASTLVPLFDPIGFDQLLFRQAGRPTIPFPNNALMVNAAGSPTGTVELPSDGTNPFVEAVNQIDGFSTTHSAFADFLGSLDLSSVFTPDAENGGLPGMLFFKVNFAGGATPQPIGVQLLQFGVDYNVELSAVISGRSRVLINPIRPLDPASFYAVAFTTSLKNADGNRASSSEIFKILREPTSVADQIAAGSTNFTLTALNQQAQSSNAALVVDAQTKLGTLEALRTSLIRPIVGALEVASAFGPTLPNIPREAIIQAWSFQTQSHNITLPTVQNLATAAGALPMQFVLPNLAASPPVTGSVLGATSELIGIEGALIYQGALTNVPYYLANIDNGGTDPTTLFWENDGTRSAGFFRFGGVDVPCDVATIGAPAGTPQILPRPEIQRLGAPAPTPGGTTTCFPTPIEKSQETIPILIGVPSDANGAGQFDDSNKTAANANPTNTNGYPVAIFIHGITSNRTAMLGIVNSLAAAGIVTVAIDLPLHAIDATDPSTQGIRQAFEGFFAPNVERDFGVPQLRTSSANPFVFANLASPLTTRDNIRQGIIDNIHLAKSLASLNGAIPQGFSGAADAGFQIDPNKVYIVAHSLGGIVGSGVLGVNASDDDIAAGVLANTGSGILKLFEGSQFFGPQLAAGLGAFGIAPATDDFETIVRFGQTALDDADPAAYASSIDQPFLMFQVINDDTVPNRVVVGDPATNPGVVIGGPLSGTEPLAALLNATRIDIDAPAAPAAGAANSFVSISSGTHSSFLDPTSAPAVTCEMQRQTAQFLGSLGAGGPVGFGIGGACP